MGRIAAPLSALTVSKLYKPGLHFVGQVAGLGLHITSTNARSWILRAKVGHARRDIGLGPYPEVTLAMAREAALAVRQQIRQGVDPIQAKRSARAAIAAEKSSFIIFESAAQQYIAALAPGWKNAKHKAQWENTLTAYAFPVLGKLAVKDVKLEHVLQVLEPLWTTKTETASRVRGRLEVVLDWCKARGYREGENPARWKGNLDRLLAAPSKVAKFKHHTALPYDQCPAFIKKLQKETAQSARALELCILTATRSGEVRGATWAEFDLEKALWTIPGERMKAGREQRVPLSLGALAVLKHQQTVRVGEQVFITPSGKPLSDMTLTALLRRMEFPATVHGFRSTFRDWAGETTAHPREVIEHALAHQLKDKAEAAYARGDLLQKRTVLMADWSAYLK